MVVPIIHQIHIYMSIYPSDILYVWFDGTEGCVWRCDRYCVSIEESRTWRGNRVFFSRCAFDASDWGFGHTIIESSNYAKFQNTSPCVCVFAVLISSFKFLPRIGIISYPSIWKTSPRRGSYIMKRSAEEGEGRKKHLLCMSLNNTIHVIICAWV